MGTNNFLPFCPTDTTTNLLTQSEYLAATDRDVGNQPGIASAKLNNKAIRQASYIVSQLAQYMADSAAVDVLDNAVPATLLAQFNGIFSPLAPNLQKFISGSGTWNKTFWFRIASGSATLGATYTNNAVTFTVVRTVAADTWIAMTGPGAPLAAGTLTKSGGTGDSTLTFFVVREPTYVDAIVVAGGGGAGGNGSSGSTNGSDGTDSSFGVTLVVATAGTGGGNANTAVTGTAGTGGTGSIGTGAYGYGLKGGDGNGGSNNAINTQGSAGGANPFNGAGGGANGTGAGMDAAANTGAGGGSAGGTNGVTCSSTSGGAGGFAFGRIYNPADTIAYVVGAGGAKGLAGVGGQDGGEGAAGIIITTEYYE